ncbi:MAG: OmpA family protein, partial [Alistipes sp.]
MKKILSFVLLAAATCYAVSSFAQEETKYADLFKQEPVQSKWQHDSEYARWSVGVNFGLPFFAGDFKSLAYDETYWGIMADMQVGYQITPTIGTRLSFGYAQNKAGAYKHRDFLIGEDAYMIYGPKAPASAMASKDLYSKIRMWSVGFNIEINVNNLFSFPTRERRWTVLASPGIYLQKFNSKLYTMEGGNRFATKLWTPYGIGLGGDVALRFKASKCIDLQLRAGMNWINNSKFDGIESSTVHNHNTVSHVGIGMVWKIGARHHKKDALMYAYPRYRAPKPAQVPEAIVIVKEVKRDTIVINVPKQEAAPIVVSTPEAWPLPSVYFQRGSAEIDFDKYAV